MGYFGLPSKACSPCRGRRIKVRDLFSHLRLVSSDHSVEVSLRPRLTSQQCDLSTPGCGQCARSHRECFGYRNPVDLLFHDQSEDVACKAQAQAHRPRRTALRKIARSAVVPKCFNSALPAPICLPFSPENQAFCFFLNNYPSRSSKTYKTMYDFVPALYSAEPADSPLVCIVTALGLAGLSCHTDASGLGEAASAWYDKALSKTNQSLRNGVRAKLDQTLLVVLLLGLYEVCSSPHTPQAKHSSLVRPILAVRQAISL
jgi:hypothetical protein